MKIGVDRGLCDEHTTKDQGKGEGKRRFGFSSKSKEHKQRQHCGDIGSLLSWSFSRGRTQPILISFSYSCCLLRKLRLPACWELMSSRVSALNNNPLDLTRKCLGESEL